MAILRNGLWGGVSGKLGNTVCYILNGKQCIRMNVKSGKPPTARQLNNRAEMGLVNKFLSPIADLVNMGYDLEAKMKRVNGYTLAVGYTKKHALKGDAPNREIDYSRVLISRGNLPGLNDVDVALDGNRLRLSWSADCAHPGKQNDKVIALAYFPQTGGALNAVAYFDLCGIARSGKEWLLALPAALAGRVVEVYAFVVSANGKAVSDSMYLGRLA